MIDRIMIINLKRRIDKWYFMLGSLAVAQFDIHKKDYIVRYEAHDAQDYHDDFAVRDAAVIDGFECFARYDRKDQEILAGEMALNWTWCSLMRAIAEMPKDSVILYLIDDRCPSVKYPADRVEQLAARVVRDTDHGDFLGLMLSLEMGIEEYNPSPSLKHGWIGCEHGAFLLSPIGAEALLNRYSAYPQGFAPLRTLVSDIAKQSQKDEVFCKGFWHVGESAFYSYGFFKSDIRISS